jgi:hypothetical protein
MAHNGLALGEEVSFKNSIIYLLCCSAEQAKILNLIKKTLIVTKNVIFFCKTQFVNVLYLNQYPISPNL